jgi:hypothetical protein
MSFVLGDNVKETASSTGTADFTLSGAVSGFRAWSAILANGDTSRYSARDDLAVPPTWEVGLTTYNSDTNTLSRTVTSSSAGGTTKVAFANTPTVWCDASADFLQNPQFNKVGIGGAPGSAGSTALYSVGSSVANVFGSTNNTYSIGISYAGTTGGYIGTDGTSLFLIGSALSHPVQIDGSGGVRPYSSTGLILSDGTASRNWSLSSTSTVGQLIGGSTTSGFNIYVQNGGSIPATWEFDTQQIFPVQDNAKQLGVPTSFRYSNGYVVNGITTGSDARIKTPLSPLSDTEMEAWGEIEWGRYQLLESIAEKESDDPAQGGARYKMGLIAQQAMKVFSDRGLDISVYSFFCADPKWEVVPYPSSPDDIYVEADHPNGIWTAVLDVNGKQVVEYGIRYAEAHSMEVIYQRWLRQKDQATIASLVARIEALEKAAPA